MSEANFITHAGTIYSAKKKMAEIKAALNQFNEWWPTQANDAEVWPLPVPKRKSIENVPWLPSLETITFDRATGEEAITLAMHALINFHRYPEDPALNIRRWPGYVLLCEDARVLMIEHIKAINHLKSELQEILSVIPNGSISLVLKKTFPGEHILAAYRHIHFADLDVRSLAFTWQGKSPKNKIIDRDQLISQLQDELSMATSDGNLSDAAIREKEITAIESLPPGEKLIERKTFAPSPRLMAFYHFSNKPSGTADEMSHAPLPFFMAQSVKPEIVPLSFWSINDNKNDGSGKKQQSYQLFLPRLNLYLKHD